MKIKKQVSSLLLGLGYPKFCFANNFLHVLHAAAAYHRLAVIFDVVENYIHSVSFEGFKPDYHQLLRAEAQCDGPHQAAMFCYKEALRLNGDSAEAWFGIARINHLNKEFDDAIDAYKKALVLDTHQEAPAEAQLHANAHWHLGTISEDLGDDLLALSHYRQSFSACTYFGVHHKRYADILRRLGYIEEAISEYEKMMVYGHRYFTEFELPPLIKPVMSNSNEILDVIYRTSEGYPVVFWDNLYWKVREKDLPVTSTKLESIRNQGFAELKAGILNKIMAKLPFQSHKDLFITSTSIASLELFKGGQDYKN
jgi:tetratricopeptide (TPR) repeat protein